MDSRWARVLGFAALGLVAALIVGLVVYRGHYQEWPGANFPAQFSHDGRDYRRSHSPAVPYDRSLIRLARVDPPLNPHHDVLGTTRLCTDHADRPCDTVIFLRDGNQMVAYSLSGGP